MKGGAATFSAHYRAILWPVLLAGTITFCSGHSAAVPKAGWLPVDKLGHFVAYGALAMGWVRIKRLQCWPLFGAWWALILASSYGLGDEFRQAWGGVRTYDLMDWLADTVGALVAVGLYLHWESYRRLMEYPVRFKRAKRQVDISAESRPNQIA